MKLLKFLTDLALFLTCLALFLTCFALFLTFLALSLTFLAMFPSLSWLGLSLISLHRSSAVQQSLHRSLEECQEAFLEGATA